MNECIYQEKEKNAILAKKSIYIFKDGKKSYVFMVTRTFSGTQTFEELLKQVVKDHS